MMNKQWMGVLVGLVLLITARTEISAFYEIARPLSLELMTVRQEISVEPEYTYTDYRQTYYSVEEGETKLGSLYNYKSEEIKVIDNVMSFKDEEYGYLPIIAIDINQVLESGLNEKGTPNIYGSVVEMTDGENTWNAIVLDACGACSKSNKIDLWVFENDSRFDVKSIDWKFIRDGWRDLDERGK